MLEGNSVSLIESLVVFGVQSLNAELARLKKDGFIIKSQRIPMAKVIRRANEFAVCIPPKNLPQREILMTEYWISK
jgi:hypothetical protein